MHEREGVRVAMEGAAAASRASSSGAAAAAVATPPSLSGASSSPVATSAPAADSSTPSEQHHPPRRRLVKASSLSFKREREVSPTVLSPTAPAAASSGGISRERDKINRSAAKVEEHVTSSNPGAVTPKHGRPPANPAPPDARPLGRRPEGARRHEAAAAVKHGEDLRIQQAKRAAVIRAQSVGATGCFKSFDSPFGNYLVPVIPTHLVAKPVTSSSAGPSK